MKKIIIAILSICGFMQIGFSQSVLDSIKVPQKYHTNFGVSFSLLLSKQITTLFSLDGLTISDYKSDYGHLTPELSAFLLTSKKNIILKNELGFTRIETSQSYNSLIFRSNPTGYAWININQEYIYNTINYKLLAGYQQKKIQVMAGIQFNYIVSGSFNTKTAPPGDGDGSVDLKKINTISNVLYGLNFNCAYKFSKGWIVRGTIFNQLYSSNSFVINKKYYLRSIQISVEKLFL